MFKDDKLIIVFLKFISTILLFCIGINFLSGAFDRYIVDQIICSIYKSRLSLLEALLVLGVSFYLLYLIANRIAYRQYKLNKWIIFLLSFILILYLDERFYRKKYIFTKMFYTDASEGFVVLDVFYLLLFLLIAVLITNHFKEENQKKLHAYFKIDIPIESELEDQFDREKVYENLVKLVANHDINIKRSLNIAVINKWGEGKTSLLNLIENEIRKDEHTIIVKFNPWLSLDSKNLTADFFDTLDEAISKYVFTGSVIKKYANNLTQIDSPFNPFKYLPTNWISSTPNTEYIEQIKELLENLNKRIFIFIDDIDRLDNGEVFDTLRMIRNSANFPYVIFLVPFDKNYVIHALYRNKIYKPWEYLKKIFDVEIALPPIKIENVRKQLFELLGDFIKNRLTNVTTIQINNLIEQLKKIIENGGYAFRQDKEYKYAYIYNILFKYLKNKRDVIRFYNNIIVSIISNHSITYLPDLFILELIKILDLNIYRALFENDNYLIIRSKTGSRAMYELYNNNIKDQSSNEFFQLKDLHYDMIYFIKYREKLRDIKEKRNLKVTSNIEISNDLELLVRTLFFKPLENDYNSRFALVYTNSFNNYTEFREKNIKFSEIDDLLNNE